MNHNWHEYRWPPSKDRRLVGVRQMEFDGLEVQALRYVGTNGKDCVEFGATLYTRTGPNPIPTHYEAVEDGVQGVAKNPPRTQLLKVMRHPIRIAPDFNPSEVVPVGHWLVNHPGIFPHDDVLMVVSPEDIKLYIDLEYITETQMLERAGFRVTHVDKKPEP